MNLEIDKWGTKQWYNKKGQLHRTDGPAVVYADGTKQWWQNDERHRTDGPAVVYADGTEIWFINGEPIKPIPKHILLWRKKLNA